jgi:hypothetical protein
VTGLVWDVEKLRIATDAAGIALWSWNVDTDRLELDERGHVFWGVPNTGTINFEVLSACIHPEDLDRVRAAFAATRDMLGAYETDFRILCDGKVRWISARGRGDDQGIVGRIMYGVFIDVTERKKAEEAREMLAGEMNHRVKNIFAITSALTTISARSTKTKDEMVKDVRQRIFALSKAHDMVRPDFSQQKKAAQLGALLDTLLQPYLAFGHFMFLAHLLRGASRVHFSLDADPGLANAVFASWTDKVKAGKVDVAVMSCDKTATIDEKNAQVIRASKLKGLAIEQYPTLHPFKAFLTYFVDNSILGKLNGPRRGLALREREIEYPFIKKSEPGKTVRLYTDDGSRSAVGIAGLFHDTSLHQVDRFFMQVRRSIAGLERAPAYPRRASRKWYLYGFYSPEMVEKTLVIYRTYFNFIAKGQDGKTPAMRIGLAKGAIRFEDDLYFI